ncbi:hypothetical protein NDN08_003360 [Rhodosorus marinus]|uniref:S1 motif domain-containing protein n=1 Tax=Rhodosorus marinus TaxID=101924 RepID=A0AAV8UWA6_9RHOD|nr:hypothetical protein NDN08_003360 [Rhodosorus marinus]
MEAVGFIYGYSNGGVSRRGGSRGGVCYARRLDELEAGDLLVGEVKQSGGAKSAWVDCGVVRKGKGGSEVPVNGRLRASKGKEPEAIGEKVVVYVKRVKPGNGRFEVVLSSQVKTRRQADRKLEDLEVGDDISGDIVHLFPRGALVAVPVDRLGKNGKRKPVLALLRRSEFLSEWASDIDYVLKEGQRVLKVGDSLDLYVGEVFPRSAHLRLCAEKKTEEQISQQRIQRMKDKRARKARRAAATPVIGSERDGIVTKLLKFGVLVDIGWKKRALLHWKRMPEDLKYEWRDELPRGTKLKVKVESVRDNDDVELSLSVGEVEIDEQAEMVFSRPEGTEASSEPQPTSQTASSETVNEDDQEEWVDDEDDDEDDEFLSNDYLDDKYG